MDERQADQDVEEPGAGTGGDEDDPRGGMQSDEYRHADPREIVTDGDAAVAGPGGAPQEGLSTEERRRRDRE